ncbi:MAG: diphthamide synthesis protein [Nanoarchaeota archaeon]|nr:diphthamide synthesis protein [Nanoarchaeota archaeon]
MFDLELDKVIAEIKSQGKKKVLIQLPDGLKTRAQEIVDTIETETDAQAFIWYSSCFGACDLPLGLNTLGIDFLIGFGHNKYHYTRTGW